jgi:hypothetical protein
MSLLTLMDPAEVPVQWRTKLDWLAGLSLHPCPIKKGCTYCDKPDYWNDPNVFYDWSFVDTAFCICLIDRSDRLAHSIEQFHRVGLCSQVLYYRPSRPPKERIAELGIKNRPGFGCWESHRAVMTLARQTFDSKLNMIFEDDVLFVPECKPTDIVRVRRHIQETLADREWDVYFLGHQPLLLATPQGVDGLWRTHSLLTHAYLQSRPFMERFIDTSYVSVNRERLGDKGKEIPLDFWFCRNLVQYTCSPMLAVQAGLKSDNSGGSFVEWGIGFHGRHPRVVEFCFMKGLYAWLILVALVVAIWVLARFLSKRKRRNTDSDLGVGVGVESAEARFVQGNDDAAAEQKSTASVVDVGVGEAEISRV